MQIGFQSWRTWVVEGYPVPSYFGRKVTNPDEVANPVYEENGYYGPVYPTRNFSIGSTVSLFRRLTLYALAEGAGGHYMLNGVARQNTIRGLWPECAGLDLSTATAIWRSRCSSNPGWEVWTFPADYVKLRTVSLTYRLPAGLTPGRRLRRSPWRRRTCGSGRTTRVWIRRSRAGTATWSAANTTIFRRLRRSRRASGSLSRGGRTTMCRHTQRWKLLRRAAMAGASGLVVLPFVACELEVVRPGVIADADLERPEAGLVVLVGAVGDVEVAVNATALHAGLASDELEFSGTRSWLDFFSRGDLQSKDTDVTWEPTARAIWTTEKGAERLAKSQANPDKSAVVAAAHVWAGYALRVAGDLFCQATFDGGPAEPNSAYYERAVQHFLQGRQIAQGANADSLVKAATAGLAQA